MTQSELEILRVKTLKKIKNDKDKTLTPFHVIILIGFLFALIMFLFLEQFSNYYLILYLAIFILAFFNALLVDDFFGVNFVLLIFVTIFSIEKSHVIGVVYLIFLIVTLYNKSHKSIHIEAENLATIEFKRIFKQQYLMPYIEKFGYKYQMYSMIDTNHIINSKLFTSFVKHGGNDKISGKFEGVNFEFSDISLIDKENSDNLPVVAPDSVGIMNAKGILFYADFNKKINSATFILQGSAYIENFNRITMDDSEFNDKFKVYSSDAQNAMYILSPALMRRILHFERRVKFPINISFVGTKIYIFIQTNKDNFEPDINKSVFKYDPAKEIKEELSHMLSIVRILKLNRKIWSVEK